jgi:hypothetical protein
MSAAVRSRIRLRILFLGLLLLFPIEMGARRMMSDEPFPGLFMPGFGTVLDDGSSVSFEVPVVVATLSNGESVTLDLNDDLPLAGGGYSVALSAILADPARVNAPDTRRWLRQQLSNSDPGRSVESLSVSWKISSYEPSTGRRTLTDTGRSYIVALDAPG